MRSADTLEKITGVRPVGIRTPSWDFSPNTLAITRDMGLLYDSSLMADVDCYELLLDGEPTGVVELPVEWIRDDAVYFNMNRFAGAAPVHAARRRARHLQAASSTRAYREGGIFQLTMHPHISGYRSRVWILDELIRYMRSNAGTSGSRPMPTSRGYAKAHGCGLIDNFSNSQVVRKQVVATRGGVVAAQHRRAAEVGAAVLDAGGDAVDAAVATSFAHRRGRAVDERARGRRLHGALARGRRRAPTRSTTACARRAALDPADYPLAGAGKAQDLFAWPR